VAQVNCIFEDWIMVQRSAAILWHSLHEPSNDDLVLP